MTRREKKPTRMNLSMSYWSHRLLRITAATDMHTMGATVQTAILAFSEMPEDERDEWYDKAAEIDQDEQREIEKSSPKKK